MPNLPEIESGITEVNNPRERHAEEVIGQLAVPGSVFLGDGADPWVQLYDGQYYYCKVDATKQEICVGKADTIRQLADVALTSIWTHSDHMTCKEVWAPELHFRDGRKVLYYAADNGDGVLYQTYYLEGSATTPIDEFEHHGKLNLPGSFNIDFSLIDIEGTLHGIWSGGGRTKVPQQNLYITPMKNLWTPDGESYCISEPEYDWERSRGGDGWPYINEGPQALKHVKNDTGPEDVFIIFSANGSWSDEYCLGQLRYKGGDPCNRNSWEKAEEPVFHGTSDVFGPGHASFTRSPDGKEDWIIYHRAKYSGASWNREVYAQQFTWHPDGSPNFGEPVL